MHLSTRIIVCLVILSSFWSPLLSGAPFDWEFEIAGSPDIVGPAGSTIGWGYTISNTDPMNWLVFTAIDAGLFQYASPLAIFDFPVVAPSQVVSVPYDAALLLGLYQLTWDSDAPSGFVNSGMFTLTADWYDDDPFNGGSLVTANATRSADYSATVGVVPEPASASLVVSALAAVVLAARRFRA